jgi:DNA-binding transcriptional LysR family regulator
MNKLAEMECFVRVVEAGSISEAGRRLGTAKSVISERVQHLEHRLGATLFERGRSIRLTDPGEDFYLKCVRILSEINDAEEAVQEGHATLRGRLRIAIPTSFGVTYLSPVLSEFALRYPELRLDLEFDERHINLYEENFDAVIRIGEIAHSSLIARVIASNRFVICASPAYLERCGTPDTPAELSHHSAVFCIHREPFGMWSLQVDGRTESFRVPKRMRANSGLQLLEAVKAGLGLAVLPAFLAVDALVSGEITEVLSGYAPRGGSISLLYRKSQRASPKLDVLVAFLAERIGTPSVWEKKLSDVILNA